jgi:hypothetical protein
VEGPPTNQLKLVIAANVLQPGQTYNFAVLVTDAVSGLSGCAPHPPPHPPRPVNDLR